jgi:hypothetical protein
VRAAVTSDLELATMRGDEDESAGIPRARERAAIVKVLSCLVCCEQK